MVNDKKIILSVRNLKQYFKISRSTTIKAVDDVSFDIYEGETFGLVGESGSGKSTIGRSIIKLYNITDGEVYFDGKRISAGYLSINNQKKKLLKNVFNKNLSKEELKYIKIDKKKKLYDIKKLRSKYKLDNIELESFSKEVQMIFQDPMASLNPRMTVKNIIAEGLQIHKLYKSSTELDDKVYSILNKVGLSREHANRYPHEFSGGQRQRIGIARALITMPKFVIADEPISALDVSIQAQVVNLMGELKEELGLTYLFIAHDLSMVKYISDRIGVMHLGKLVELGTADQIYSNPVHPYTRSLLSAIPQPDPKSERNRERIRYDKSMVDYNAGSWKLVPNSEEHYVLATSSEYDEWTKNYSDT